jgi:hypothetical protein
MKLYQFTEEPKKDSAAEKCYVSYFVGVKEGLNVR